MTPRRGIRLVPVALSAWAAAIVVVLLPDTSAVVAGALAVSSVVVTVWAVRRPTTLRVVLALALAAGASVCLQVAVAHPSRAAVGEILGTGGRTVVVTATVVGRADVGAVGDRWFDATATALATGRTTLRGAIPVRMGLPAETPAADLRIGSTLRVRASALPPRAGERAVVVLRAHGRPETIAPATGGWGILAALRAGLAEAAAALPGPGAALVPGLAVGDTSAVTPALSDAMTASSLTHLTAVSGANCAIVVGLAFGVTSLFGARRAVRVVAAVVVLAVFVLLVTPEPSVVRAAAMASVSMLALALGRTASGVAVLSVAVGALLVVDPWLCLSLGFALSAVATASLLLLAPPLARGLSRLLPLPLALAVAVPLAAQLACGPLLVLVDPHVPLLGVIANLLAAPAAPIATIAGFLACLTAPIPLVAQLLTVGAWVPATWIAAVADTVAALPGQRLPWAEGAVGAFALAVAGAALVLAVLPPPQDGGPLRRGLRRGAIALLTVALSVGAGRATLIGVAAPWTVPSEWQVAMCDVGQGDAILVRAGDAIALVDTGPDPELLRTCLQRFGVSVVDLLVLTHFDADHSGGVAAVVGRAHAVLHGPADVDGARTLTALEQGGARLFPAVAGQRGSLGGARWRVLWPARSVGAPGNDASVAMRFDGAGLPSTVMLGDLSEQAQRRMRAAQPPGEADVMKVAHHGSADQDAALYAAVDAELALIPVGKGNDYGHPRERLLDILRRGGARVARTDLDGHVALWRDDDAALRLWRESGVGGAG